MPHQPVLGWMRASSGEKLLLTYPGDKGLLTVAPNRTGKGTGPLATNMLCHRSSLVCFDPKSENAALFARWRAQVLGQKVFVFDPLHVMEDADIPAIGSAGPATITVNGKGSAWWTSTKPLRAGFNIVEMIRRSKHPVADAKMVANALIPMAGPNPFWPISSQSAFAALACWVALDPAYPNERTTRSLWNDLSAPEGEFIGLLKEFVSRSAVGHGFTKREADDLLACEPVTFKNIRKSLRADVGRIFDDPHVLECLSTHSLDFGELQREAITVFLVLPGWAQEQYGTFFRLLLNCMFKQIEREGLPPPGSRPGKTLMLFDEFASLRVDSVREALPRLPGYGVQFWPFVQDLGQLRTCYGDGYETFLANAGITQAFGGTGDDFTADYLSRKSGTHGAETYSETEQSKGGGSRSTSMTGRPGLFPHEIANLNAGDGNKLNQVLFYTGAGYVIGKRHVYYEDFPEFVAFQAKQQAYTEKMKRQAG